MKLDQIGLQKANWCLKVSFFQSLLGVNGLSSDLAAFLLLLSGVFKCTRYGPNHPSRMVTKEKTCIQLLFTGIVNPKFKRNHKFHFVKYLPVNTNSTM